MKKFIVILGICVTAFSVAETKKETKPLELPDFSGVMNEDQHPKKANMKFNVTCRTNDGREIKADDPEYSSCLEKNKAKTEFQLPQGQ